MYARNVMIHLKPNSVSEFTRKFETDVLPLLRKQSGFTDEITFLAEDGRDAVAISLWDRKESAEQYGRDTYPKVLKGLTNLAPFESKHNDLVFGVLHKGREVVLGKTVLD